MADTLLSMTDTTMRIMTNIAQKGSPQGAGTCLLDINVDDRHIDGQHRR